MEHAEAQTAIAAIIEAAGYKVAITGGHETRRGNWVCDAWRIVLERQYRANPAKPYERYEFEFYTGTGHRVTPVAVVRMIASRYNLQVRKDGSLSNSQPAYMHGGPGSGTLAAFRHDVSKAAKPVAPHIADLAYSWVLDGEAVNQSFADWCAEFGSDPDSRKAFATYEACCAAGLQLRQMFTPEQMQAMRDALQDY